MVHDILFGYFLGIICFGILNKDENISSSINYWFLKVFLILLSIKVVYLAQFNVRIDTNQDVILSLFPFLMFLTSFLMLNWMVMEGIKEFIHQFGVKKHGVYSKILAVGISLLMLFIGSSYVGQWYEDTRVEDLSIFYPMTKKIYPIVECKFDYLPETLIVLLQIDDKDDIDEQSATIQENGITIPFDPNFECN